MSREDWLIIGISGVTCGGKTTLANKLLNALTPVYAFHQDKYFYPDDSPKHIKCEGLAHNNYDILSALDMEQMYRDVMATIGDENKAHQADTETNPGRLQIAGKKFLILEGFTVLNYKPLLDLCNLRYYVTLEYEECQSRRVFRLYSPPDVAGYFDRCVWPAHLHYRAEIAREKDINMLDGTRQDALDIVISHIKALGATEV